MKCFIRSMLICLIVTSHTSLITLAESIEVSDDNKKNIVEHNLSNIESLNENIKEMQVNYDTNEPNLEFLEAKDKSDLDSMDKKELYSEESIVKESVLNEEANEPVVEKTVAKQQYSERNTETVEENTGDGTQDNPYLVSNAEELKTHFEEGKSAEQTIYIKLTEDIIYTNKNFMIAHSSIVLDGNNFSILYDGTSYTVPHFSVDRPGASITLKNIQYGNEDYPNSTNRGIILINAINVELNIENITYSILNGAQPFYAPSKNSKLNFYGSNAFELKRGNYSEEFSEGIDSINFIEGSFTTVQTNNSAGYPFFRIKNNLNLNIQDSATLEITTNKDALINTGSNNSLNIGKDSTLSINFTNSNPSMGANSSFIVDNRGLLDISYSGSGKGIDMKTTKIVVYDPNEIRLNSINTDKVISAGKVELTNIENQTYQLLSNSNNQWSQLPFERDHITLNTNNKIKSYVYKPRIVLSGISTSDSVGTDTSKITTYIKGIPEHMVLPPKYFADYIIFEKPYSTDGLINQSKLSEEFENSQDNHQSNSKVISGDLSEVVEFNNLVGDKTYYIYARVRAFGEVDETTAWYESGHFLPAHVEVSFPKQIIFSGADIIKNNNDNQVFQNRGNVPIDMNFKLLEESDKVTLVDRINKNNARELKLDLKSETFKWNFLDESKSDYLKLEPFMKNGNEIKISLLGEYSSPHHFIEDVRYKINVSVSQYKGGD